MNAGLLLAVPVPLSADYLIGYFVFGAIAGAIAAAFVFVKKVLPIASFASPCTRVKVMASQMVKGKKLRELADSYSYRDVIAAFEGTAYEKHVAGKTGIREIESGLTKSLAEDYEKVVKMSPGRAGEFFKIVSRRYEVKNAKAILTAKATGSEMPELLPSPMTEAMQQRLRDAPTVQETLELLKLTSLGEAVEDISPGASVEEIQKALDKFLFEKVFDKAKIAKASKSAGIMNDEKHLLKMFGNYIDILNIKTALRAVNSGLGGKEASGLLLDNYFFISEKQAGAMAEAADVQSAVNALEGTPYFDALNEAMRDYGKGKSLYEIEKGLDSFYGKKVKSFYLTQPFGLTPLGCYLLIKEGEIEKLKAILNGISEGIPKEKINELFIGA